MTKEEIRSEVYRRTLTTFRDDLAAYDLLAMGALEEKIAEWIEAESSSGDDEYTTLCVQSDLLNVLINEKVGRIMNVLFALDKERGKWSSWYGFAVLLLNTVMAKLGAYYSYDVAMAELMDRNGGEYIALHCCECHEQAVKWGTCENCGKVWYEAKT